MTKQQSTDAPFAVLIVDDDDVIRVALQRALAKEGYQLHAASSGEDALVVLDKTPIDLLLTDYNMPGMTGVDLAERVMKTHPDVIRIILTAADGANVVKDAINRAEIYRFLSKPWDDSDLRLTVRAVCERRRMERERAIHRRIIKRQETILDGLETQHLGPVRLLLVDDEEELTRPMAKGLANAGFQTMTSRSADSALEHATTAPPDVAVVDLGMPGGGIRLIRELKAALRSAVHVLVLTGRDDEDSRAEAFEAGADDYVVKPIGIAELRYRIAAALRGQRELLEVRLDQKATERRLVYGQEASALLAHDLNNGLAVALSNVSYLLETSGADVEDDQHEVLTAALRSMRRMSSLVANFVDIARFEDAAVKPALDRTPVRTLIESVIKVNAPATVRGIQFEIDCVDDLEALFDQALVERVLHNLIGNALRYCSAGGKIVVGGKRCRDTDASSVEIWVTNTGPQIPEAIRTNLFGKYVQGKGGKRGMGLYFCRLVAEAHGGTIVCEPWDSGPCFSLRLPCTA